MNLKNLLNIPLVICLVFALVFLWSYVVPIQPIYIEETEEVEWRSWERSVELEVPSDYMQLWTCRTGLPFRISLMVDDDPVANQIADWIMQNFPQNSDGYRAYVATQLISENIRYVKDDFDHWKLPWETVRDGCGDCEDFSILFCAVLRAMGQDAVILSEPNHALVGVCIDAEGYHTMHNGKPYYFMSAQNKCFPGIEDYDVQWVYEPGWSLPNYVELMIYIVLTIICLYGIFVMRE